MLKLIKNIGCATVLAIIVFVSWKAYRAMEDKPKLTDDEKKTQAEVQKKQAISIRLEELEKTNGKGRVRKNKDVENAARLLYNTRHQNNALPLL